jgi:hypothetical protein
VPPMFNLAFECGSSSKSEAHATQPTPCSRINSKFDTILYNTGISMFMGTQMQIPELAMSLLLTLQTWILRESFAEAFSIPP